MTTTQNPTVITDFDEIENDADDFFNTPGYINSSFEEQSSGKVDLGNVMTALEMFEETNNIILAGDARRTLTYMAQSAYLLDIVRKTENSKVLASIYRRVDDDRIRNNIFSNSHCPQSIKGRFIEDERAADGYCW